VPLSRRFGVRSGRGDSDDGGVCSLISYEPDEGWEPGDIVAFRCQDCLDRWDVELAAEDIRD
jgi:hypothetical protein